MGFIKCGYYLCIVVIYLTDVYLVGVFKVSIPSTPPHFSEKIQIANSNPPQ